MSVFATADALIWLPAVTQPAEAARLYSNRALCFLKLAAAAATDAATRPPPAAATGAGAVAESSADTADRECTTVQGLAAAAVDDCTAALTACEQNLAHKVRKPTVGYAG